MPLYKTIIPKKNTKVYVWHITESLEELDTVFLTGNSRERVSGMKSEIHQKGFLSIRHLLQEAGYHDDDLYYTANGKPHLKDSKHISITHSFVFSAIIISDIEVGIDIEMNREKIKRVASKFVNAEFDYLNEIDMVEQLTVIWGAKESLFKIYPYEGLSFKKHIIVDEFNLLDTHAFARIAIEDYKKEYLFHFQHIDGYTLVYALPNYLH